MMIKIADMFTNFFNFINKNQIIKPDTNLTMINLGCGLTVAEGWINIDSNINAFLSKYPETVLKLLYKLNNFVLRKHYNSKL
ncbi:hypothetical protein [Methanobacterium movens]